MYISIFPLFGNIKYAFYKAKSFTKVILRYMLHGSIYVNINLSADNNLLVKCQYVESLDKLQYYISFGAILC